MTIKDVKDDIKSVVYSGCFIEKNEVEIRYNNVDDFVNDINKNSENIHLMAIEFHFLNKNRLIFNLLLDLYRLVLFRGWFWRLKLYQILVDTLIVFWHDL